MTDDTIEFDRVDLADALDLPQPPVPALDDQAPVFVDASGRRQRRVRRAGRLLAIPAAGYVALLISSALGGPTVHSPLLPLPAPPPTSAPPSRPQPPAQRPGGPAHRLRLGRTSGPPAGRTRRRQAERRPVRRPVTDTRRDPARVLRTAQPGTQPDAESPAPVTQPPPAPLTRS
ncbi:hypothetical protein [Kitasatospora azatica]|uniref:hypothetical protein n=1 Tax=Kitasatospora azatica TaxID=58347 RepID=UPI000690DBE8|nr:hypothetical protein [Kitasatospora azatica]